MEEIKNKKDSLLQVELHEELQSSFIDYAISVIISRALPDVKDGFKPSQRRIIVAMDKQGISHNKPYRKSVKVVGEVLANYHPHGDQAVYQTMVGMTQDFIRRYPLLDGQGNWGSIDGDNAAAMRYTEIRMRKICQEFLGDIDKNTVLMTSNFDETLLEPTVLPSRIPNLLINGSSGIAVGMATYIPPHNLNEIMDATIALAKNLDISDDDLISFVKGPDFPLGGIVCGRNGLRKAYKEGRGSITVRGIIEKEETGNNTILVIKELPYQVIKSDLVMKIAQLSREKVIEGISKIRDESNKKGIRVVIELKRDACADTIINLLYKHTSLQVNLHIALLALINNKPQLFTLKTALKAFIEHRKSVIYRRTLFDKEKAAYREHILAGLEKILNDDERAINFIKQAKKRDDAINILKEEYLLSDEQSKSVVDLRLYQLTSYERDEIAVERKNLLQSIEKFNLLLSNESLIFEEIIHECELMKNLYGDSRRTIIEDMQLSDFDPSAYIVDEEVVITLTKRGYIKRVLLQTYEVQHRGGKGKMGMHALEEGDDIVQDIFLAKTHDELLFFTNLGRVYSSKVYEVPEGSRTTKGRAIINVLPLQENERVIKLLCARNLEGLFLMLITKKGITKRTSIDNFNNIRQTGIRAISLNEGDELAFCMLTTGKDTVMLATKFGMAIRFYEVEVRAMGRQAAGVRGIRLKENDELVGALVVNEKQNILFVTESGYGKRVDLSKFRIIHRGGMGVRTIPTNKRNGMVIGLGMVSDDTDLLLIDENGKIIRISPQEIRTMGRQAQGVRLIRLSENQKVACIATLQSTNEPSEAQERKLAMADVIIPEEFLSNTNNINTPEKEIEKEDEQINEDED
jgi:DNA gyrase subunit A